MDWELEEDNRPVYNDYMDPEIKKQQIINGDCLPDREFDEIEILNTPIIKDKKFIIDASRGKSQSVLKLRPGKTPTELKGDNSLVFLPEDIIRKNDEPIVIDSYEHMNKLEEEGIGNRSRDNEQSLFLFPTKYMEKCGDFSNDQKDYANQKKGIGPKNTRGPRKKNSKTKDPNKIVFVGLGISGFIIILTVVLIILCK